MANKSFWDKVRQATWTIKEAAYLVNNQNPDSPEIEISDTGSDKISSTFVWLTKEYQKERLHPYKGSGDSAQFSPGTLMRHLKDKGHYVSESVWKEYNKQHAQSTDSDVKIDTKKLYVDAANLIWEQCPDYPASQVGQALQELHSHIPKKPLKPPTVDTIRKWLKGKSPYGRGRPKKSLNTDKCKPDLTEVVVKLGY